MSQTLLNFFSKKPKPTCKPEETKETPNLTSRKRITPPLRTDSPLGQSVNHKPNLKLSAKKAQVVDDEIELDDHLTEETKQSNTLKTPLKQGTYNVIQLETTKKPAVTPLKTVPEAKSSAETSFSSAKKDSKGYFVSSFKAEEPVSIVNPESDMLTTKYNPTKIEEVVGNRMKISEIIRFLENWQPPRGKKGAKQAILISGPAGIGKTSTVRLISKIKGYSLCETNASDQRNKAAIEVFL